MKSPRKFIIDCFGTETEFHRGNTIIKNKIHIQINMNTKTTKDSFLNTLEKETLIYPIYICYASLDSDIKNNDYFYFSGRKLTVRGLKTDLFLSKPYGISFYAW